MQTQTSPTWDENLASVYPKLGESIRTDVIIIGGGLAGVLSAYLIAREGKKVTLLEKGILGGGVTVRTTAFLTQAIDSSTDDLVTMLGEDNARLVVQSGVSAIAEIRTIVERENIACDFSSCPAYLYAKNQSQSHDLAADAAVMHRLGFAAVHTHNDALGFKNSGYVILPDQAKFHPLKFLSSLASRTVESGVRIFENTAVVALSESGQVIVRTAEGHSVVADDAIITTHQPFNKPAAVRFKKVAYRSYVLEMSIPSNILKEGLYWDQGNPFIYFRIDHAGDSDRLMLGGADHRADIPFSRGRNFHSLERSARELLGSVPFTINRKWYGPILESIDGLPFIGAYAPHRSMATGFSGNGMTYSAVSAMMFRDALIGRTNPWTGLYSPTRAMKLSSIVRKAPHYVMEFFGGVLNSIRN